jgi:hypothetical protein
LPVWTKSPKSERMTLLENTFQNPVCTHKGELTSLAVHPTNSIFTLPSVDKTYSLHDITTFNQIFRLPPSNAAFTSLAIHPDRTLLSLGTPTLSHSQTTTTPKSSRDYGSASSTPSYETSTFILSFTPSRIPLRWKTKSRPRFYFSTGFGISPGDEFYPSVVRLFKFLDSHGYNGEYLYYPLYTTHKNLLLLCSSCAFPFSRLLAPRSSYAS